MNWILLLLTTVSLSAQYVISGIYNQKGKKSNPFLFNLFMAAAVTLFFTAAAGFRLRWTWETVGYGLLFGVSYISSFLFQLYALKTGSISVTSLILSYSLIIPTVFGAIAYRETPSPWFYIGLAILAVSLFFVGFSGKKGEEKKVRLKWLGAVAVAFIANGMCSVIQSHFQRLSEGAYKSEFMIAGMAMVVLVAAVGSAVTRKSAKNSFPRASWLGAICGVFNATVNLLVMLLVSRMDVSLVFPLVSAGSLIMTCFAAALFFRDRLDLLKTIGLVTGVVAIVFLNL